MSKKTSPVLGPNPWELDADTKAMPFENWAAHYRLDRAMAFVIGSNRYREKDIRIQSQFDDAHVTPCVDIVKGEDGFYRPKDSNKEWPRTAISYRLLVALEDVRCALWEDILVVDRMLTLACHPVIEGSLEGCRVWRATWLRKNGSAYKFSMETGYIARNEEGRTVHGISIAECGRLLEMRAEAEVMAVTYSRLRGLLLRGGKLAEYEALDPVVVKVADARRAGLCEAGIADWISRHMPGKKEATIAELMAIKTKDRRDLLATAIISSLRRQGLIKPATKKSNAD